MGTALKLFTGRCFHGTSTAQISKDVGVATGIFLTTSQPRKPS
ncbi:hypothetical protein [Methanosarcina acetivorans]|nr:hypothetical protein [Methanosarcina acetivorans]